MHKDMKEALVFVACVIGLVVMAVGLLGLTMILLLKMVGMP
jgi:hypothetical protein